MSKKRVEREIRAAHRRHKKEKAAMGAQGGQQPGDWDDFSSLNTQLGTMGLTLKQIPGDGNCLFRALGDQLFGNSNDHLIHRTQVVSYMRQHRDDFEPFVEDDLSFDAHLSSLAENGTFAGNDSIVAFARKHCLTVVIHQLNKPLWQIHGGICTTFKLNNPVVSNHYLPLQAPEVRLGRVRFTSAIIMVTTTTVSGESETRAILLPNFGCVCPILLSTTVITTEARTTRISATLGRSQITKTVLAHQNLINLVETFYLF